MTIKAAMWVRVSTERQDEQNQVPSIEQFAAHHGYEITRRYILNDVSASKGEQQAMLRQAMNAAWRGEFSVFIVWALDRVTRQGAEDALRVIREFRERSCAVVSIQESWLNGNPVIQDVLVAFAGWQAEFESTRHSERVRAGLAKRKAKGLPVGGRVAGAKDRKPRKRRSAPVLAGDGGDVGGRLPG